MLARNALSTASRKIKISGLSVSPIRSSLQQLPARHLSLSGAGVTVTRCADFPNVLRSGKACFESAVVSSPFHRQLRTTAFLNDEVRTVNTPPFADSISEGDVRWHKAVGDQIKEDDIVCEIETDKTAIPCPSQVSGVIEELLVKDGEKVTKGQALYKIRVGATSGKGAAADKGKEKAEPQKKEDKEEKKDKPAAEEKPKRADEQKEKTGDDAQSGPIPGKLPKVPAPPKEPLKSKPTSSVPVTPSAPAKTGDVTGSRSEHREKMNRMRLRIAERLKEAQNTAAMLTTFNEVDMSNIIEMRNKYKDVFMKKHGVKLGFMSPFIKAAAYALQDQPVVNAVIDGTDILHRDYIDISVAVASPKGLVVPVIRNVEDMSYADIELTLEALSGKARDGKLAIEDMSGGTFTISNGGVFGSLFGTPIINPPQSAILGMHATNDRPVAVNGQVVIRPMMFVALTYDHRLIDGREAVTFLKKIKQVIEDPRVLLLDL